MIHVEQRLTVAEFLAAMRKKYRDIHHFRAYVRAHPRDLAAKLDLEDFESYVDRPELQSETMERAVSLIPVTDEALSAFTRQRLAMLEALAQGRFGSVRQLAAHLGRDVHNIHADLQLFRKLGIVEFERGPGNRRMPRLVAHSIRILVGRPSLERLDAPRGMALLVHTDESHET